MTYQCAVLVAAIHEDYLSGMISGLIGVLIGITSLYVVWAFRSKLRAREEEGQTDVETGYSGSDGHGFQQESAAMSRPLI